MNLFQLIPLILAAIPAVVQAVETACDSSTPGGDKKRATLDAVTQAAAMAAEIDPGDSALIAFCTKLASPVIDAVVAFYHLIGKFAHKSQASAAVGK